MVFVVTEFRATGVGSEIRFPNLSSISGVAYAIRPQAQAGGLVSFPVLTDTVWTSASTLGAGSRIELPALVSAVNSHFAIVAVGQITLPNLEMLTATPGNGAGSFTVEGSGVFDLPKLTSYESLAFTLQGDARIDIPLLTQLKSGSLSLSGAAVFPVERLTSIDASSIFAGGGAKIVLPGITAFAMGDSFDVDRFQALGAGSENTTSKLVIHHQSHWPFIKLVAAGGTFWWLCDRWCSYVRRQYTAVRQRHWFDC